MINHKPSQYETATIQPDNCHLFIDRTGACKIGDCDPDGNQVINATIPVNETYSYSLGGFGTEEGGWIVRQAKHYQISRVNRNGEFLTYEYKPSQDYAGTDEVELRSERGSN